MSFEQGGHVPCHVMASHAMPWLKNLCCAIKVCVVLCHDYFVSCRVMFFLHLLDSQISRFPSGDGSSSVALPSVSFRIPGARSSFFLSGSSSWPSSTTGCVLNFKAFFVSGKMAPGIYQNLGTGSWCQGRVIFQMFCVMLCQYVSCR